MPQLTIRPYQPGDETGILELFQSVFQISLSLEFWRWCFQLTPELTSIIVVAEQEGQIVGHYAVQPRPFWFQGAPCWAGLAVSTMIHPSARNLTTLIEMAQLAYELCRQQGITFLYAFPRSDTLRIRQALLNWQVLPDLEEWEGSCFPTTTTTGDVKVLDNLLDPRIASFPSILQPEQATATCGRRSREWLQWRFFAKPGSNCKLLWLEDGGIQGYAVVKYYRREEVTYGHILDWYMGTPDPAVRDHLLSAIIQQFQAWNVQQITCWAQPLSSLNVRLSQSELKQSGRKTSFAYLQLGQESNSLLAHENQWKIYMADSDVY